MICFRQTIHPSSSLSPSVSRGLPGLLHRHFPVRTPQAGHHGRGHWMRILRSWVPESMMSLSESGSCRECEKSLMPSWNRIGSLSCAESPYFRLEQGGLLYFRTQRYFPSDFWLKDSAQWPIAPIRWYLVKISTAFG